MFRRVLVDWGTFGVILGLLISSTTAIKCYQCPPDPNGIKGVCTGDEKGELKDCGRRNACRLAISASSTQRFCCYIDPNTQSMDGTCVEGAQGPGSIDCHCTEEGCNYEACKCENGVPVKGTGVPANGTGTGGAEKSSKWNAASLSLALLAALTL